MTLELSFDLVMEKNMPFVEGCYRLDGGSWKVFVFSKEVELNTIKIEDNVAWQSGAKGLIITLPGSISIDKDYVASVLSSMFKVKTWSEVHGPDSIQLR